MKIETKLNEELSCAFAQVGSFSTDLFLKFAEAELKSSLCRANIFKELIEDINKSLI